MKNAMSVLAVLLLSACGGETFEERSEHLATAQCAFQKQCASLKDYDYCHQDIVTDMKDAKVKLDAAGQTACMNCMQVKIEELEKGTQSTCKETPSQSRVIEVCGASGKAACAGYP